jgi:hypothetical protein
MVSLILDNIAAGVSRDEIQKSYPALSAEDIDIARVHAFGANLVDPEIGRAGDIDTCAISLQARSGLQCAARRPGAESA